MASASSNVVTLPTAVYKLFFAINFEFCKGERYAPSAFFGWDADGADNKTKVCLLTNQTISNPSNYQCYYLMGIA